MPNSAPRKRSRGWLWISLILGLVLLATLLLAKALQPWLAGNHVRYLVNAGRYSEALEAHARLVAAHPEMARRLKDFEVNTLRTAADRWKADPPWPGSREQARALDFFTVAARQPALGKLARRSKLALLAQYEVPPTTATLAAARDMLRLDGYSQPALWWLARLQYDPAQPLTIPNELREFREQLTADGAAASAAELAQLAFLKALVALERRDWAQAAAQLESFATSAHDLGPGFAGLVEELRFVQGLALLRTGRSADAVTPLQQYLLRHPANADALAALLEAQWSLRQIPWAAAVGARLRQAAPDRIQRLLTDLDQSLQRATESLSLVTPEMVNAARLATLVGLPFQGPLGWSALRPRLIAGPLSIRQRLDCMEVFISRRDWPTARALAAGLVEPAGTTSGTLPASLGNLLRWLEAGAPASSSASLARLDLSQLLSLPTTQQLELTLPGGTGVVILQVQGYAEAGVWPLLHARCGPAAATWYLADSRAHSQMLLLPVPVQPAARKVELAVSLLNGEASGRRQVLLGGVYCF
jgi:hypothetical protein